MVLVYQNAIGVNLTVNTNFDLTGYSAVTLKIKKPSSEIVTATPTVFSVTSGILKYETVDGDLDEVGAYQVQAFVTYGDGDKIKGEIAQFKVYTPIE